MKEREKLCHRIGSEVMCIFVGTEPLLPMERCVLVSALLGATASSLLQNSSQYKGNNLTQNILPFFGEGNPVGGL